MKNRKATTSADAVTASPVTTPFNLPSHAGMSLSALRLPQDFGSVAGVKKVLTTVPAKKPGPQSFFRVRGGEAWRFQAAVLQLREDGECYLVVPELYAELVQEVRPKLLYTGITRDGSVFLWPVNVPGEDGRLDTWSQSAHAAAKLAEQGWVRLVANRSLGAYDLFQATNIADEPAWPELSFEEIVNLAFRDRLISSLDHPVVKRLRGEI